MTVLALLLALLAGRPAAGPDPVPDCPGGQTLTADDLAASGATTLADLLRLIDGLRMTTVDGFAWQPFAGGGAPFQSDPFVVLVDGVAQPTDAFGASPVRALPVPLLALDRVAWCPAPDFVDGRAAPRGTLHLVTRADDPGLTARAAWQIGNETGDPGPYRYTDRTTDNVDKSGPDVEGVVAYGREPHRLRLSTRVFRYYATDPAALPRNAEATPGVPLNLRVVTLGLDGATAAWGGLVRARATGRYDSDLWFFEPAGRELPVRRLGARLDLDAERPLGPGRLLARAGLDLGRMTDEQSGFPGFRPDWRSRTATAHLGFARDADRSGGPTAVGVRVVHTDAQGPGLEGGAGFVLGTAYARQTTRLGPGRLDTRLAVSGAEGGVGGQALQAFHVAGAAHAVSATVAYTRRLPEEEPGYGYWAGRGYTGLLRDATPYGAAEPPRPASDLSARLAASADGRGVRASASGGIRAERGVYAERPAFVLPEGEAAVAGPVTAVPDAHGTSADARLALDAAYGIARVHAFGHVLNDLGGTDAFRAAWARVPALRGGVAVTLRPDAGLSARAAFTAQSATRWPGYAALDGAEGPRGYVYTDGTPALRLLDVTVTKRLLDGHARVVLAFRNVLNTEERYHPLGAALAYRLFLRVEARL